MINLILNLNIKSIKMNNIIKLKIHKYHNKAVKYMNKK